jgi:hypothetical protein
MATAMEPILSMCIHANALGVLRTNVRHNAIRKREAPFAGEFPIRNTSGLFTDDVNGRLRWHAHPHLLYVHRFAARPVN